MHTPQSGKKGNEMTFGKKIERWTVIAAVCALLLAACLPFAFAEGTASAEGGAQAVTATAYGSLDTDDLWYFAEGELDLDGLKGYVEESILPVLRANSVEPVVIAVVDTGLDRNNSLFAAGEHGSELLLRDKDQNLLGYNSFYAWKGDSAKANDSAYYLKDEANDKHGTAVSSVLAVLIRETGLSDYIKIYPVVASYSAEYVAEQDKSNITTNSFDPEAIRLGVEHAVSDAVGADVVNLSLCSTTRGEASWRDNAALQSTLTEASQTATVIAAAGNEGTASSAHYFYPAAYDNVIGVMGHAADNSPTDKTNYGSAYDIFAPGTGVMISTENGVFRTSGDGTSGTSMSAPFVSFAAALLRLSLTAETLADSSFVMPRNGIINDMVAELGEGDAVIKAKDGGEYKKLDILKLVSKDIRDIDYAWDDPTEITVTASQNGSKLSDDATVTVQTLRETGKGRSLLEFTASVLPVLRAARGQHRPAACRGHRMDSHAIRLGRRASLLRLSRQGRERLAPVRQGGHVHRQGDPHRECRRERKDILGRVLLYRAAPRLEEQPRARCPGGVPLLRHLSSCSTAEGRACASGSPPSRTWNTIA